MPPITLAKPEKDAIVQKLQAFTQKEWDHELGQFEAVDLLNFVLREVGPFIYNQALADAQSVVRRRTDDIVEAIDNLTQPVERRRPGV